jgi:hypothetical protein
MPGSTPANFPLPGLAPMIVFGKSRFAVCHRIRSCVQNLVCFRSC